MRRTAAASLVTPIVRSAGWIRLERVVMACVAAALLTLAAGCADDGDRILPPSNPPGIQDLTVESSSNQGAILRWTLPEEPGRICELRYSLEAIDEENWTLAIPIPIEGRTTVLATASQRRVLVPGLYHQVRYYFSVRTGDQEGALSVVSNSPHAFGGTPLPDMGHWFRGFGGGQGPDGPVTALVEYGGNLVVAGAFLNVGGVSVQHIALFDGSEWSALGAGLDGIVTGLAVNGEDLYAVGRFEQAGDVAASHVARWDGFAWYQVGLGLEQVPWRIATHDGLVVVGFWESDRPFLEWDGVAWTSMPIAGVGEGAAGNCICLISTNDGLLAGGEFDIGANCCTVLLRWDGTAWARFPGKQPPFIVARIDEVRGQLVATLWSGLEDYPEDTPINLRWNGGDWVPLALTKASQSDPGTRLGGGIIVALLGGKPIAVGNAASGAGRAVVMLEGDTWLPLGVLDGLDVDIPLTGAVVQGHLYIAGEFQRSGRY